MLDSSAFSRQKFVPFGFSLPYDLQILAIFISGTLYILVLFVGSDILSRRKKRHNFVPFGFSLPYDVQILAIFYLWNTIPFGSFWCFLGVLTFEVLDSAANSVGNIDIVSLLVLFGGSDVLSVGFSS